MKNKLVFAGLLIGVLAIGIMVAGCASTEPSSSAGTSEPTKFEGTWINDQQVKYVFTNNTWQLVRGAGRGGGDVLGKFTFTETPDLITFTTTAGGSGKFSFSYEFRDNVLFFMETGDGGPRNSTGNFTRQP